MQKHIGILLNDLTEWIWFSRNPWQQFVSGNDLHCSSLTRNVHTLPHFDQTSFMNCEMIFFSAWLIHKWWKIIFKRDMKVMSGEVPLQHHRGRSQLMSLIHFSIFEISSPTHSRPTKMSARKTLPKLECMVVFWKSEDPPPHRQDVRSDINCEWSRSEVPIRFRMIATKSEQCVFNRISMYAAQRTLQADGLIWNFRLCFWHWVKPLHIDYLQHHSACRHTSTIGT